MKTASASHLISVQVFISARFWSPTSTVGQCVTVPKISNDTDTHTFFPVPNISDTGSETFFRYQFFPIPVPRLFSGTNFFRYRFRYHQKNEKFPVPGIPGTGTSHSALDPETASDADQLNALYSYVASQSRTFLRPMKVDICESCQGIFNFCFIQDFPQQQALTLGSSVDWSL